VAREMKRQGMSLPLLIGGATTSKVHTAVKIAPMYDKPVVHVLDASKSVAVVSDLVSPTRSETFSREIDEEYQAVRDAHARRQDRTVYLTLEEARANPFQTDWSVARIVAPASLGVQRFEPIPIPTLREFIDWTPFFPTWQLSGKYPAICDIPNVGGEARRRFDAANAMLDEFESRGTPTAAGVLGLFAAASAGDDVILYTDESRTDELARL